MIRPTSPLLEPCVCRRFVHGPPSPAIPELNSPSELARRNPSTFHLSRLVTHFRQLFIEPLCACLVCRYRFTLESRRSFPVRPCVRVCVCVALLAATPNSSPHYCLGRHSFLLRAIDESTPCWSETLKLSPWGPVSAQNPPGTQIRRSEAR